MIYDLRPGELAMRSSIKQTVDIGLREPLGSIRYLAALEPDTPVILTNEQWIHVRRQGYSGLELVQTDRAELPTMLDTSDKVALSVFLTGEAPKQLHSEKVATVVARYNLDQRVAECVVRLTNAGMDEHLAVVEMRSVYEQALKDHKAFQQPWLARTDELIESMKGARV